MSPLAHKSVLKMNGIGNEIVVLDLRGTGVSVSAAEARTIARAEGLGFDQLMVLLDPRSAGTEAYVQIFNNDGSEAGACGNGTRCVAWALMRGTARDSLIVETRAGKLACKRLGETRFAVDMGEPRLSWQDIPVRDAIEDTSSVALESAKAAGLPPAVLVNMGNPHAVFFVARNTFDLAALGAGLEHDPAFPDRANISFADVLAPDHIRLDVWERGAGLTKACGSAACATLVAAVRRGLTARHARITLPGGELEIAWRESDNQVEMTGPVAFEYEELLDPALFSGVAA